jgi:hypothetical protein
MRLKISVRSYRVIPQRRENDKQALAEYSAGQSTNCCRTMTMTLYIEYAFCMISAWMRALSCRDLTMGSHFGRGVTGLLTLQSNNKRSIHDEPQQNDLVDM